MVSMRTLEEVVLFGADTSRSRAYLWHLLNAGLKPAGCVILSPTAVSAGKPPVDTDLFDNRTPLAAAARSAGIKVVSVITDDINSAEAVDALSGWPQRVVLFSGPSGALVKQSLFNTGKTFLHAHPGKLPEYRGSTTMYYSLLAEGKIWVSVLALNPKIDEGPVIDMMEAELPEDLSLLDHVFDPVMRARIMVRVLERFSDSGNLETSSQADGNGRSYFVIHPVLKHLAVLSADSENRKK